MNRTRTPFILALFATGALAFACGGSEEPEPAGVQQAAAPPSASSQEGAAATASAAAGEAQAASAAVSEAAMAEAKSVFATRCAACHGASGHGDGAAAAALNPKPRSFADQDWQESVTDEHIVKVIVEGGMSVGLSPLMAANPDLKDEPEVVQGLVQLIRGFAK